MIAPFELARQLRAPSTGEVERLLSKLITRIDRHLVKRGRIGADVEEPEPGPELFASQPLPRRSAPPTRASPPPPLCARHAGYSLHAATWLRAHDREGLERLCRYGLRPPLSLGRLSALEDGSYTYRMKRRYSDGRELLRFSGEALLLRLIALIPPPRMHLVRYAGIFAPNVCGRRALTGQGRRDQAVTESTTHHLAEPADPGPLGVDLVALARSDPSADAPARVRRLDWATLLRRAFAIDVLACPRCQGRMRLVAVIEDPTPVRGILSHLGLSATPARAGPRRVFALGLLDALGAKPAATFDGLDSPSPLD